MFVSAGPGAEDVRRLEEAGLALVDPTTFHGAGYDPASGRGQAWELDKVLSDGVAAGVFPGAVALVLKGRSVLFFRAFGKRLVEPATDSEPMNCDTIFDMASLTKPLVTTTLILQLVDEGAVRLGDAVRTYFPEFAGKPLGGATVSQLLTHTAGFPGWRPVYLHARGREEVLSFLAGLEAVARPGETFVYSDLGFMLLGLLVERLTGGTLDVVARTRLFEPLRMLDSSLGRSVDPARVAPTEDGNLYEQGMIGTAARRFGRWREGVVRDEIHDGNAFYALDGIAGHAGFFSSAVDVALLMRSVLSERYVERVVQDQYTSRVPGIHRGLGWDLNRGFNVLFGPSLGPWAFGHTGFTGTSVVVDPGAGPRLVFDPEKVTVYILLSNRVHPSAHNSDIITYRARFHQFASKVAGLESPETGVGAAATRPAESAKGGEVGGRLSIVVVGAHAFDAEAMAGATAAAAVAAGHRVTLLHLTRGERGNKLKAPEIYGRQLEGEMARAAAALGVEYVWPGYLAGGLPGEEELAAELAAFFAERRADIIMTHWRGSWHPRHVEAHRAVVRAVGMMAETATQARALATTKPQPHPRLHPWPLVLFGENCEDLDGFIPDAYIDVSDAAETAWQAMAEYELFRRESSPDAAGRIVKIPYEQFYRAMPSVRGIEAGVRYAQAFKRARSLLALSASLTASPTDEGKGGIQLAQLAITWPSSPVLVSKAKLTGGLLDA